ncbi:MAG: hypothetical protein WCQ50_08670 [Spirochaetota bacterium]
MKRLAFAFVSAMLMAVVVSAAPISLAVGSAAVDGLVSQGEYANFTTLSGIGFGATLSDDGSLITLAIQAPTSGWVAIGLGAGIMDGAWMLLAYDADGKPAYSEQLGAGHFHQAVKASKILKSQVKAVGGSTVLEIQVKGSDFIKDGTLPVILAYGKNPDFTSKHVRYAKTSLVLAQ